MTCRIIGHRGARALFPENTVEGFRAAIALGLRAFELDVGVSRDGHVVVHHDAALNPDIARMGANWPGGSLPLLRHMTLEDIRDFDVGRIRPGSPTAALFPRQQPVDGACIPTLAEVLASDSRVEWTIEMKLLPDRPEWTVGAAEMADRVLHAVDAADAGPRCILQSFDWRAPRHVARTRPDIRRAWLTRADTEADPALWWDLAAPPSAPDAIAAEGGGAWTPHWPTLTPDGLARAHALGLTVIPWTVNDPEDMARLAGWGVDGIITDAPDLAREAGLVLS